MSNGHIIFVYVFFVSVIHIFLSRFRLLDPALLALSSSSHISSGEATKELNLLPPLAVLGREHTIATLRSCQAVHISGRQKVTARL
ncbi:hypothetical protein RHMOL_Rhmol11G0169300 [Rhododendron molle]|uniref:Uncharacterized protein n=1 Tax=Rhododendron molle TaxID=49168 RepID=A0ACC0LUT1_RHOML|nr:hypothetical protein RHMOL_Rhmol11G0169300 [Rhododendron molle]